jgi:uncharacterized membrane protein
MMLHIILDALGITGLAMLGYGLYLISPVHMFLVMGTLLVVFALLAERGTITINLPRKKTSRG